MVDNKDDNEYDFADLDTNSPELLEDGEYTTPSDTPSYDAVEPKNNIIRNVAITIVALLFSLLLYKFFSAYFKESDNSTTSTAAITPITPITTITQPTPQVVQTAPVTVTPLPDNSAQTDEIKQQLVTLDEAQQNLTTEISTINNKLTVINTNMNEMNTKIANFNATLATLMTKMDEQSNQLSQMIEVQRQKQAKTVKTSAPSTPRLTYYIQAVIPGRAWLIATNGSTLTVREGSYIRGYGSVKMIDPTQGRVLLSSGQVIRFSQQDS